MELFNKHIDYSGDIIYATCETQHDYKGYTGFIQWICSAEPEKTENGWYARFDDWEMARVVKCDCPDDTLPDMEDALFNLDVSAPDWEPEIDQDEFEDALTLEGVGMSQRDFI